MHAAALQLLINLSPSTLPRYSIAHVNRPCKIVLNNFNASERRGEGKKDSG